MSRFMMVAAVSLIVVFSVNAQDKPPEKAKREVDLSKIIRNVEISYDVGFEPKLEIENGDGFYILHIAQWHYSPGITENERRDIIATQKNIYNLISAIQKSNEGVRRIFAEAYTVEDLDVIIIFSLTRLEIGLINENQSGIDWLKELGRIYLKRKKEVYDHCEGGFDVMIKYLYRRYAEAIYHRMVDGGQVSKLKADSALKEFFETLEDHPDNDLAEQVLLYSGGVMKLFLDSKGFSLLPAETTEGNFADGVVERYSELPNMLKKAKELDEKKDYKKGFQLYHEAFNLQVEYNEKCFRVRENIALDQIANSLFIFSDQKLIPLIYGEAHDFTDNVRKWNIENPDKKFGLVRFSPAIKLSSR